MGRAGLIAGSDRYALGETPLEVNYTLELDGRIRFPGI